MEQNLYFRKLSEIKKSKRIDLELFNKSLRNDEETFLKL